MESIRKRYGVPAKRGGRVRYNGNTLVPVQYGRITSARGDYLRIRLDGWERPGSFHPTWKLEYLDTEEKA